MNGKIYWISQKSEFLPKPFKPKDERANLVYATKIHVKNDGFLKNWNVWRSETLIMNSEFASL
ncbi:hypothetical protein MASR1M29_01900 [Cloacibacterium normanense]